MSGASSVAETGVSFEAARERLEDVAARLFESDPRVRSVGIYACPIEDTLAELGCGLA